MLGTLVYLLSLACLSKSNKHKQKCGWCLIYLNQSLCNILLSLEFLIETVLPIIRSLLRRREIQNVNITG
jgi:hypothetical protein